MALVLEDGIVREKMSIEGGKQKRETSTMRVGIDRS